MYTRVSLWLLASAGVLVGHVLGYAVAHPGEAERSVALAGHAYMGPAGTVLIPAGLLAVLAIAVRTVRRGDPAGVPSLRALALAQIGLFLGQEVFERIAGPAAPVDALTERGVWFGIVAQVLVAWVTLRLVRFSAAVVRAIAATGAPRTWAAPRRPLTRVEQTIRLRSIVVGLPPLRGPPRAGAPVSI